MRATANTDPERCPLVYCEREACTACTCECPPCVCPTCAREPDEDTPAPGDLLTRRERRLADRYRRIYPWLTWGEAA